MSIENFKIIEQKRNILKDELTGLTYPSKKLSKLCWWDNVIMQIYLLDNYETSLKNILNDFKELDINDFWNCWK
jgi:hypothetical protein